MHNVQYCHFRGLVLQNQNNSKKYRESSVLSNGGLLERITIHHQVFIILIESIEEGS